MRGDDSVGLEAVRIWRSKFASTSRKIRVELAEVPGIGLLNLLIGFRHALLVDAVISGKTPGFIHQIQQEQITAFTSGTQSAHGWGIAETLAMGKNLYSQSLPETIKILGIEILSVEMGNHLSQLVEESLPKLVNMIETEIQRLLSLTE